MGLTGIVSILLVFVIARVSERVTGDPVGLPDPPLFAIVGIIAYGVMANVCYTGGWLIELLVRRLWGPAAGAFGEIAFALGLAFSVLLTLSPVALAAAAVGINLGVHALGSNVDAPGVPQCRSNRRAWLTTRGGGRTLKSGKLDAPAAERSVRHPRSRLDRAHVL